MAEKPDDLQPAIDEAEPELTKIRDDMADTRASLSDKVGTLEDQVLASVETAQNAIEQTVASVKDNVNEIVASVQHTFDVKDHIRQRPWMMMGIATAAGIGLGYLTGPRSPPPAEVPLPSRKSGNGRSHVNGPRLASSEELEAPSSSGLGRLLNPLKEEIGMLERLGLGAGMGVLRDLLQEAFPSVAPKLGDILDRMTTKLGGQAMEGPVLKHKPAAPNAPSSNWESNRQWRQFSE